MLYYEAVIVYDAALDDEKIRRQLEEVKNLIKERQAEVLNIEEWGRRRLAYPIRKKESGYYIIVNFALNESALLPVLERSLRLNEAVLRHIVVKSQPPKKEAGEEKSPTPEKGVMAETPSSPDSPSAPGQSAGV